MGRVLSIEPEASKAEALRQLVRNDVGAEFVLVTSAYAAVVAINRQLPDLVLFSESISDRHRERVVDHLKSVSRNGTPPTFSVPALHNGNRAAFITQIGNSLGQKKGQPAPAAPAAQAAAKTPAAAPAAKASAPPPVAAKPAPAVKTDDIDPVELELLSQASALETSESHEDDGGVNEVVASAATAGGGSASNLLDDRGAHRRSDVDRSLDVPGPRGYAGRGRRGSRTGSRCLDRRLSAHTQVR